MQRERSLAAAPIFSTAMLSIADIQTAIGVTPDNVWGPKSQAALIKAPADTKRKVQTLLGGLFVDGEWGLKSQSKLNALIVYLNSDVWIDCEASSFADTADLAAFKRCKLTGKSDVKCFAVGDNGVGQFGKVTAQDHTPMVAIHRTFMVKRWGSVLAAAHRPVYLSINGVTISATCEDRISAPGRIDCNPAVLRLLNLKAPLKIAAKWRWA